MTWNEIRTHLPMRWVVLEAITAHNEGNQRRLDTIAVADICIDYLTAMHRCRALYHEKPHSEFYFANTEWESLNIGIPVQKRVGVRPHAS